MHISVDLLDLQPGVSEERAPLALGVVAHVRGIAHAVGLLGFLAHEEVVGHEDAVTGDAGHLAHRGAHVLEVVCGYTTGDHVEPVVVEWELLRRRNDVGLHPRRGIETHDLERGLAQASGHVAAARRNIERRPRTLRPLDEEVEVFALAMRLARPVGLGPLVPDRAHPRSFASATTRSAAESIVSST